MNIRPFRHLVGLILRQDPESMSPKVIPLSLQQSRREPFGAVAIEPTECSAECGSWDSETGGLGDDVTPRGLGFVDCFVEEIIEQQVLQFRVL